MVRQNRTKTCSFLTKTEPKLADFSLGQIATAQNLVHSVTSISESLYFSTASLPLPWDRHLRVRQVNTGVAPQIVSCHGRPQFLFLSGIQCSACYALLESSMHCTWPIQQSSFLYCGIQHILSCCFRCSLIKYAFNILVRQDAVILFNCQSVTITWCNSTATCAPVFSLTAGIHALLVYTNLHAKFLKIQGN